MTNKIRPIPDTPQDNEPGVVATPEGDNELLPDQPLRPVSTDATAGLQAPRGSEADAYKRDHD